jgi:hypothetical protein
LINKVKTTGSLLDKRPAQKRTVLAEEKLDAIGAGVEMAQRKSFQ